MDALEDLLAGIADVIELRETGGPTPVELAAAPLLDDWLVQPVVGSAGGVFMLAGEVTGHPVLGSQWITTSPLLFLSDDRTWARTRSRLYRLGKPALETLDG